MTAAGQANAATAGAAAARRGVVVVTGLSGAGKASVLRVLEDLGHETVDNPPLSVLGALLSDPGADPARPLAVGVDARTRGFDAEALRAGLAALRARPDGPGAAALDLVYLTADDGALLRRFSETRRRHPLAEGADVAEGIARERALLAPLAEEADWVLDTTDLPLPDLRRAVERRCGGGGTGGSGAPGAMAVAVVSFAFPRGLPREADFVFDLRFLRNPHYDPALRPMTGRDAPVAAFVEADPDFAPFWARMTALLDPLLPRHAAEGKKYLTVALGCTGGRHRSVLAAERLAHHIRAAGWRVDLAHRELAPTSGRPSAPPPAASPPAAPPDDGRGAAPAVPRHDQRHHPFRTPTTAAAAAAVGPGPEEALSSPP